MIKDSLKMFGLLCKRHAKRATAVCLAGAMFFTAINWNETLAGVPSGDIYVGDTSDPSWNSAFEQYALLKTI